MQKHGSDSINSNEKTPGIKFFTSNEITGRDKSAAQSRIELFSLARSPNIGDEALKKSLEKSRESSKQSAVAAQPHLNPRNGVLHQLLVTGVVLIVNAACGMPIGYSAILLPQIVNTTDSMNMSVSEASWVSSVHSAAAPIGSFASGPIMDVAGRKKALLISMIPLIGGWTFIATAPSYIYLLIGRVLAGISAGLLFAPVNIYIAEIATPNLRGTLMGVPYVAYSIGILFVYGLGHSLNWRIVAWCSLILPLLSCLCILFIPETPAWLARHMLSEKALKALQYLRGDAEKARRELSQLVLRMEMEKSLLVTPGRKKKSFFVRLKKKSVLKPIIINILFNIMQILAGVYLVIFYAVNIIKEFGGSAISPSMTAIMTAAVRLLATVVYCFLLRYMNRRKMGIISGLGAGISATVIAIILLSIDSSTMSDAMRSVCAVLLVIYIASSTGYMLLKGILVGELLPAKVRGQIAGYLTCFVNLLLFGVAKVYPLIMDDLTTSGLFFIFGTSSLFGALLIYCVVPETKGKSLGAIEDYFMENSWFWWKRKPSVILPKQN